MFSRARPSHGAAGVAGKQAQGSKKGNNFYTENYKTWLKELNKSQRLQMTFHVHRGEGGVPIVAHQE